MIWYDWYDTCKVIWIDAFLFPRGVLSRTCDTCWWQYCPGDDVTFSTSVAVILRNSLLCVLCSSLLSAIRDKRPSLTGWQNSISCSVVCFKYSFSGYHQMSVCLSIRLSRAGIMPKQIRLGCVVVKASDLWSTGHEFDFWVWAAELALGWVTVCRRLNHLGM